MKGRISLIDLQVYERLTPLPAGLMAAAVLASPDRARACEIDIQTWTVNASPDTIARAVLDSEPDLVGFSTYVWNARLVRRVVRLLAAARPGLPILLGGPQVVSQAAHWIAEAPRLLVGEGEGEPILVDLAERLLGGSALAASPWVSGTWDGGAFSASASAPPADLDALPSPYLTGLFPRQRYTQAILETNRGCPFSCSFCFWGLGERKVRRFADDRVRAEVEWICREGMLSVFVADANFGMYPGDEMIAQQLADHRRRRGTPLMVAFNSMKNKPDRMVKIAQIVGEAGLATTQSMAIQSMDLPTLGRAGRGAIKIAAYEQALRVLDDRDLTTYVELIWPLPGETAQTFADGIDRLCAMGAQTFVVYPLLALPNTRIAHDAAAGELVIEPGASDGAGEYDYVTGTREVSPEAYRDGLWLVLALNLLYNARALHGTMAHLRGDGVRHIDVLRDFAAWLRTSAYPVALRHRDAIAGTGHAAWAYWGAVAHDALHTDRTALAAEVDTFARGAAWWRPELAAWLEVDRLLLPWLYADSPVERWIGEHVEVRGEGPLIAARLSPAAREIVAARLDRAVGATLHLDRRRGQLPHFRRQSADEQHAYAYGQLQRVQRLSAVWAEPPPRTAAEVWS